jgi:hypothetical protein
VLSILQTGNLLNAPPGDRPSIKNAPSAGADVGKPLPAAFANFLNADEDDKGIRLAQSEFANTVSHAKGDTFADRHIANKRRGADSPIASTPTPTEANYLIPRSLCAPPQQSAEEIDRWTEIEQTVPPKQPAPNGPTKQATVPFIQLPQLPALPSEFQAKTPPIERSIVQGAKVAFFPKANVDHDEFGEAQISSTNTLSRAKAPEFVDRHIANKRKDDGPRITLLLTQVQPSYLQHRLLWAPTQSSSERDRHADAESTVIGERPEPDTPIKPAAVAFTGVLQAPALAPEPHAPTSHAEQASVQPSQAAKDVSQSSADLPRHEQSSTDTSGRDQGEGAGKGTPDVRMIVPLAASKEASAHDQPGERVRAELVAPMSGVSTGSQQQHTSSEPRSIDRSEVGENVAELPEPPRSAPPSTIRLQVPITHEGNEQGHVDIRVSQRASTVLVSVGTEDADLAQSLRRHLPELTEQLAQNGIESAFAGKQVSPAQHTPLTGRHNNDGAAHDQDAPRQYRESREEQSYSENRRERPGRSSWLEELTTPNRR